MHAAKNRHINQADHHYLIFLRTCINMSPLKHYGLENQLCDVMLQDLLWKKYHSSWASEMAWNVPDVKINEIRQMSHAIDTSGYYQSSKNITTMWTVFFVSNNLGSNFCTCNGYVRMTLGDEEELQAR